MDTIYHITSTDAWTAAQAHGEVIAESLAREGFIHCSRAGQLLAVAERFFAMEDELLVLAVDAEQVSPWLVNEGPAGEGDPFSASIFPHVYAPIPVRAVVASARLVRGDDGHFVWPSDLPRGLVWP